MIYLNLIPEITRVFGVKEMIVRVPVFLYLQLCQSASLQLYSCVNKVPASCCIISVVPVSFSSVSMVLLRVFWVPVVFAPVFRPSDPVGLALSSGVYVMPATYYNNTVIGVIFLLHWTSYDLEDVYLRYSTKQWALISIPDSYQSNESMCGSHRLKNG